MRLRGPRTFLQVRVGDHQSADVVLHLRPCDLDWFHQEHVARFSEVLRLLETSILPRLFGLEIEAAHAKHHRQRVVIPAVLGPGGMPVLAGDKQKLLPAQGGGGGGGNQKKRKRGGAKKKATVPPAQVAAAVEQSVKEKDLYYAFGTHLQLAYKLQDPPVGRGATLILAASADVEEAATNKKKKKKTPSPTSSIRCQELTKLNKTILIWCYKQDPDKSPLEETPAGGGFPRSELVPLASLFRTPPSSSSRSET